jgi:hypothetical protein
VSKRKPAPSKPLPKKSVQKTAPSDRESNDEESQGSSDSENGSIEWTEDDEILLNGTYKQEISLWRKTLAIFNCAPQDLFPWPVTMSKTDYPGYEHKEEGQEPRFIQNDTNLSANFCESFGKVLSVPSIAYAAYRNKNLRFEDDFQKALNKAKAIGWKLDFAGMESFKEVCYNVWGKTKPAHCEFLKYLPKVVRKGFRINASDDSNHLKTVDFDNISKAWDLYVKETSASILSAADAHVVLSRRMKKNPLPLAQVLARKKEWILTVKRKADIDLNVYRQNPKMALQRKLDMEKEDRMLSRPITKASRSTHKKTVVGHEPENDHVNDDPFAPLDHPGSAQANNDQALENVVMSGGLISSPEADGMDDGEIASLSPERQAPTPFSEENEMGMVLGNDDAEYVPVPEDFADGLGANY